jgi:hypothetical protein
MNSAGESALGPHGGEFSPEVVVTPGGREDLGRIASRDLGGLPILDIVRVPTRAALT